MVVLGNRPMYRAFWGWSFPSSPESYLGILGLDRLAPMRGVGVDL